MQDEKKLHTRYIVRCIKIRNRPVYLVVTVFLNTLLALQISYTTILESQFFTKLRRNISLSFIPIEIFISALNLGRGKENKRKKS